MKPVLTQMMEYPSNGSTATGFLAQPGSPTGRSPGLVVIQEWWGLVDHIKEVASRFAEEGFVSLAPDLYHGAVSEEPDEARKLAMALDRDRAVAEIQAAIGALQALSAVQPGKAGLVGWCLGGGLALSTAAQSQEVGAVVAFYGRPLASEDTGRIQAPVLGLYGEEDHGIPPTLVHQFEQDLRYHGIPHRIILYPNAGHAFFNDSRPQAYQPEAATDAWHQTIAWLRKYLRVP